MKPRVTKPFEKSFSNKPLGNAGRGLVGDTAGGASRPLLSTLPAWQVERARRLHRICICIEKARVKGRTLHRALRFSVWSARHAHYRSAPKRKLRLSYLHYFALLL